MERIRQPKSAVAAATADRARQPSAPLAPLLALQRAVGNRAVARLLQRRVNPEDVSSEMVGRKFRLTEKLTVGGVELAAGTVVEVLSWTNASPTVSVRPPPLKAGPAPPVDVPKKLLRPEEAAVAGVAPYSVGLDEVVRAYERGEQKIADEKARKGGPRPGEVPRLEGLQANRLRFLNQRLIQQTMFNRFDPNIKKWTDHYNAKFGFTGGKALDPDLVKAMLFQETQMGTSGEHLEVPPSHPVKTRFNLDSSAAAMILLMREEEPALIATYHLQNVDKDLSDAQDELRKLKREKSPNAAQVARIAKLEELSEASWEAFLWQYRAPGQSQGLAEAVDDFFDVAAGVDRNDDYDFWIQATVRWLFLKRKSVSSWEEAARAFNGGGPDARRYKAAVTARMAAAKAAQKKGQRFVVDKI